MSSAPDDLRPPRHRPLRDERLGLRAWRGVALRAFRAFREQGMTDWAATLAYYAILAMVPILLVAASLLTLLGASSLPETIANEFASLVQDKTSGTTASDSAEAVQELVQTALDQARGGASVALVISLVLAMNGASGAFAAAGRALNRVHHVQESRNFVRHKLADVATAGLVILLLALAAILFVLGGGFADSAFSWLGLSTDAPSVWGIVRFPVGVAILLVVIGIVYSRSPDFDDRRIRLFTTGSITALAAWVLASIGFLVYVEVAGFGSAYGALGGAIVLLFWLWLSAATFLFGAQVDAEIRRTRLLRNDGPPPIGLYLPPADGS